MHPEERGTLLAIDRLHGAGIVEGSVGHDPLNVLGVTNVLGGIVFLGNDDKVGELARLQGAEIAIESDVFGAIQGAATERFQWCHAALHVAPHFPVGADAIQLTVTACLDETALVDELFGNGRHLDVIEVF